MAKKKVLGKGLSALLDHAGADGAVKTGGSAHSAGSIAAIAIDRIEANPWNPRSSFEEYALEELKVSIETHGIIQPLTVREVEHHRYQLISGERRFRAAQLAGIQDIPCYIRVTDDQSMLELALVENIQREDLNAMEIALSYQRLIDECDLTQEKLSQQLGKSRSNIANFLRLLKLPAPVQVGVREELISTGHARALVSAGEEAVQIKLFKKIIAERLSVRETESLIQEIKQRETTEKQSARQTTAAPLDEQTQQMTQHLSKVLETAVKLSPNKKGGGKLVIHFDSRDQLDAIVDKINTPLS